MDLIERLVGHDRWTTGEALRRCRELPEERLDEDHPIDHRTVRATLDHMIWNMEVWTGLMLGVPVDRATVRPATLAGLTERHARDGERFHALARRIADEGRQEERWMDTLDNPPTAKTYGGALMHIVTHDVHHRAQLFWMLDRLGLRDLPEGDLLGWEQKNRFQT